MGQPVSTAAAQPRRLALLAVLGRSAPRAVSREKLIAWFWQDADEERGRPSLNQALYALRTELGSEDVVIGERDLRLNLDLVGCDAADFETAMESGRTEDAALLYRGPFLDGFHLTSAPEFEQWVEDERRAMAHRYSEALESLATTAERKGDHGAAVSWWRRAANADPGSRVPRPQRGDPVLPRFSTGSIGRERPGPAGPCLRLRRSVRSPDDDSMTTCHGPSSFLQLVEKDDG